uniref:Putative ATPase protein n=1 Tax=uncultured bacterium CSL144 TaxID=1091570 RepID=G4WVR6_9BACT|nr:putative ATPase protein [uncultured bacterium CSL144]
MTGSTRGLEPAAFAGRAVELSTLNAAAGAAKAGQFSAVLISGEPGVGKTRLAEETCNYARELGFEVAAGRCFDTQSRLAYFPFIQAFRHLVRHASRSIPPEERRGGTEWAGETAAIIARLAFRAPRSARQNPEISSAAQTELFESVICFLRARSEICPLLVVLEDLDWADEGSLSLLVHLVRMLASARLLIIGTCQGNDAPERLELVRTVLEWGRHRWCQRIRLRGLAGTEAASLVEQLLGSTLAGETERLAADIGRLSNGNPLFIHQIVRHLVETGRLSKGSGRWVASSGWESKLAAEDGIREVVDARLSPLSEGCRLALSHAAVLGEEFELEVLAHMLPFAARDLADLLEEASGAGIVNEARTDETADYAFAHALIRQSLYERQSRPAQRALHAGAAHAIEAVHQADFDSHLSQLALHYTKAGRAGDLAKAAEYSMRAGEAAYTACAYADAACHWRAALKLASTGDRRLRVQLLERLGEASLLSAATPAEATHHLQAALKLYTELGQESDIARVHARLVTVISLSAMNPAAIDMGQAVSHSRRAEKLLAVRADQGAEGDLLIGEAIVAHAQFRTEDGLAASERAMEIGQLLDNAGIWCQAAALHGHFLWTSGKLKEGLGLMEQALERAERTRDVKPRFAAAWLLGFSYLLLWDPTAAERTIQLGLADSDTGQVEFLRQVLVLHLGIAHIFTGALAQARSLLTMAPHRFLEANLRFFEGEWTQAEDLLSQQIERSHMAQSKQQHWTASLWLARLKRVQGDDASALDLLTHTPLMAESLLRIPEEIATRSELALVRLARGEVAEARSEVRRCRTLLNPGEDWRALSAFVDRAEAAVLAHDGFLEEARPLWILAGKVFSRYQLPWEVAETLVTWGTLLLRLGKAEEGAANLSAAAQIYRHLDLGARWDNRIEELRGSAKCPPAARFDGSPVAPGMPDTLVEAAGRAPSRGIHSLVTTHDVALLATLIHDAIAHLMNAIDKAAKLRAPIERIAAATEKISRISTPVERLARALEEAGRNSAPGRSHGDSPGTRPGRSSREKLDRSHDPGRPL